jgi:ATP-dependent RNA helicase DbpA
MLFNDLPLSSSVLKRLFEIGFAEPTEIQKAAIPKISAGTDAVIRAETGSGKTAAYALPLLSIYKPEDPGIKGLIIVPTRELALQVHKEMKNFAVNIPNIKISAFYGGHPFDTERKSLKHPPDILIATPGRLADHLRRETADLSSVNYLVIDEADKLLEMGFEEELKYIIRFLSSEKQTILLSATFPEALENLTRVIFNNKPLRIETDNLALPSQIEHYVIEVPFEGRLEYFVNVFGSAYKSNKDFRLHAIIFCNTREKSRQIAQNLTSPGFIPGLLHGEMEQIDRDKAMAQFRNQSTSILVATDLAARGIDIATIEMVINFEIPDQESSFLHRIGRTGRAGRNGTVITFATTREIKKMQEWPQAPAFKVITAKKMADLFESGQKQSKNIQKVTIHIHAGRKGKISKGDIVGALIGEAGLTSEDIGLIEVFDHFSYVAVPKNKVNLVIEKLTSGKIKGRKIKISMVS